MRSSLVAACGALAALVALRGSIACSKGPPAPARTGNELDCVWVDDRENCFRKLVAEVDRCLGNGPDAAVPTGTMPPESTTSCSYGGRVVTSTTPLNALEDGGEPLARSFEVVVDGGVCLKFDKTPASTTLVSGGRTVVVESDGTRITVKCDGKVFVGTDVDLVPCLSPRSAPPGWAWSASEAGASFQLLGMNAPVYSCRVAAVDAAVDARDAANDDG